LSETAQTVQYVSLQDDDPASTYAQDCILTLTIPQGLSWQHPPWC